MKTILITGCSTGIGHATAELFAQKGWKVFAGSRHPNDFTFEHPNIQKIEIDVNDPASVAFCFASLKKQHVRLDCVVNNAGYGLLLPFEDTPREEIEKLFRTNVLGLMDVSRAAVTMMRPHGAGTIVNISSVLGTIGAPWYAAYCATKWAVEGFSESLAHEVHPLGLRVKIVEPGGTRTEFHHRAYDTEKLDITDAYRDRYLGKRSSHNTGVSGYATPESISQLIYKAATDASMRLRYSAPEAKKTLRWQWILGRDGLWKRLYKRFGR